jgi:hypothetical protein
METGQEGMDWNYLFQSRRQTAGCFGQGNKLLGSKKCLEFFDLLRLEGLCPM